MSLETFQSVNQNRRAVRNYDPTHKISHKEMEELLDEALLAPTSFNLQPCRFVIIDTPEGKAKIAPFIRFNQKQNETSSAMVFLFGKYNPMEHAEEIYGSQVAKGWMEESMKEERLANFKLYYAHASKQELKERAILDVGLVAMNLMLVAKSKGYDTCPIGGFEKDQMASVLGLDPEEYFPVILISIGKQVQPGHPSYRVPAKDLIFWNSAD